MAVIQRIDRGDIWKSKARSLQLQLRERFRIAVYRRPIFANGYFSDTMQRWHGRIRDFRRDSLPSSTSFYRKRVAKNFNVDEDSTITRMLQAVAVPVLGNVCHVFMHGLNRVQVYGAEKLHDAVLHRPKNKPLLTVSNHVASVDDPFVIASLLPRSVLLDSHNLRWTLCASDRCFKNPLTSAFFRSVKVLPVSRGDGIYQKGMDMAISKLNSGGWVHIFPEGSRSRDGGKTMRSPKRGVGRLVLDADSVPLVVPFVHTGMQDIMPVGANFPRIGKTVTVLIGDPISVDDLVNEAETHDSSRGGLYDAVASRIGKRLHEMKAQVDKLALEQLVHSQNRPVKSTERAAGIIHNIDWESFGMESYITSGDESKSRRGIQFGTDSIEPSFPDWHCKVRVSHEGGIVSRIRSYMEPTELLGFAARGLFASHRPNEKRGSLRQVGPLKAWRNFLETNGSSL